METRQMDPVSLGVDLAEAVLGLPAVATIDWCSRAAERIAGVTRSSMCALLLGTIDENGRVRKIESAGAAASKSGARAVRLEGSGTPELAAIHELRDRIERLPHIGWTPTQSQLSKTVVGLLSSLPGGRNWRASAAGRLWAGLAGADPLVGITPVGEFEPGRILMVQIMPTSGGIVGEDDAVVLKAALPLLGKRAMIAFGPLRSTPGQWLTPREQEVLHHLILGRSVKEIASVIGRSPHTVHDHVKSLHRKLNATSRGELIARALGHIDPAGSSDGVEYHPSAASIGSV